MRQTGQDIYKFGSPTNSATKYLYFNHTGGLAGFRFDTSTGFIEYSNDNVNWLPLGAFFPRVFTQETNIDTADRHYYQGYQNLIGVSISDAIQSIEFRAALDDGNFNYTSNLSFAGLQAWFDANVLSTRFTGTKSIVQAIVTYKPSRENEIAIARLYSNETA